MDNRWMMETEEEDLYEGERVLPQGGIVEVEEEEEEEDLYEGERELPQGEVEDFEDEEEEEDLYEGERELPQGQVEDFEDEEEEEDLYEGERVLPQLVEVEYSKDEEEEVEQLEEMRPPLVTSWVGPDGGTVHGILCIDDGIIRLMNQIGLDDCPICYKPCTQDGKHQLCCLPCGHTYGFSCIKQWLLHLDKGKCPQCNSFRSFKDAILLYPCRLRDTTAHLKASSAALFPFTQQGFRAFKEYEDSRLLDIQTLLSDDISHVNILLTKQNHLAHRLEQWHRAYPFQPPDSLKPCIEALGRRIDALDRLISALNRRIHALEQRDDAFESRFTFGWQMYKEHHVNRKIDIPSLKQVLGMQDEKKMPASDTLRSEVKAEPTTNTTERRSLGSRSNREKGPGSISKPIHKRKKSNKYLYYFATAFLTTVPLAVGYTLLNA